MTKNRGTNKVFSPCFIGPFETFQQVVHLPGTCGPIKDETQYKIVTYQSTEDIISKQILMQSLLKLLILSVWLMVGAERAADYTGDKLVQINNISRDLLKKLMRCEGLDEWSMEPSGRSAIFRVKHLHSLVRLLKGTNAKASIKHHNVQDLIDEEASLRLQKTGDWFGQYHPLSEIKDYYFNLAHEHEHLVRFVDSIGKSYEGRDIFALHFNGLSEKTETKPNKIWIQCLIHAREWISGSTCQYLAQQLVKGYDSDDTIRSLLDANEIIMIPVVNPDGYEHTWKRDRLWRKNRHPFRFGTGVDLNRNFAEEHWCRTGASNVPFADTYCGPEAGSEPETKAIMSYYNQYAGQVAAAIDVHSFSQLILRPNGFTEAPAPDEEHLVAASNLMEQAIFQAHSHRYTSKRSSDLYLTSGSATDYFYWLPGQAFRPYSVALELRPGPENAMQGFLLNPKEIRPCVEEVFAGFMAFVGYALDNPLLAHHD